MIEHAYVDLRDASGRVDGGNRHGSDGHDRGRDACRGVRAGMMVTDGLNGWFVANLLSRAQAGAPRVSRLMAFSVSGVSIGTAVLGVTAQLSSSAAAWAEVHQGRVSLLIVWIVLGSFAWGWWSTRAAQHELTETFGSLSSR